MAEPPAAESLGLPGDAAGVFPSQLLERAVELGWLHGGEYRIPPTNVQPASVDLRLGPVAYRMRCSFLPDSEPVEHKLKQYVIDELDLRDDGAVLETNRPYLIPLIEEVSLPPEVRGRANPKSSTGRLDVFTRVITDRSYRFDEIAAGYRGKLWLEVVPLSFTVRVRERLALNQLRLVIGSAALDDDALRATHAETPLLYHEGRPVPSDELATANGLFLGLDLRGGASRHVGWCARPYAPLVDLHEVGRYEPD